MSERNVRTKGAVQVGMKRRYDVRMTLIKRGKRKKNRTRRGSNRRPIDYKEGFFMKVQKKNGAQGIEP
jgi:hypothetical protein